MDSAGVKEEDGIVDIADRGGEKAWIEEDALLKPDNSENLDDPHVSDDLDGSQFTAMGSECRKLIRANDEWIYQYDSRPEHVTAPSVSPPNQSMEGDWWKRHPIIEGPLVPIL